jgi:hypothetical protein
MLYFLLLVTQGIGLQRTDEHRWRLSVRSPPHSCLCQDFSPASIGNYIRQWATPPALHFYLVFLLREAATKSFHNDCSTEYHHSTASRLLQSRGSKPFLHSYQVVSSSFFLSRQLLVTCSHSQVAARRTDAGCRLCYFRRGVVFLFWYHQGSRSHHEMSSLERWRCSSAGCSSWSSLRRSLFRLGA